MNHMKSKIRVRIYLAYALIGILKVLPGFIRDEFKKARKVDRDG